MYRPHRNPDYALEMPFAGRARTAGGGRKSDAPASSQLEKVQRVRLAAPPCTIGITDGSERGDYVPQPHILEQIGRLGLKIPADISVKKPHGKTKNA